MSFVLDASTAVSWAFANADFTAAQPALIQVQASFAVVPVLWHFEVASAIRKALSVSRLSPNQASGFLADLGTLDIQLHHHMPAIQSLLQLADQFGLTTYDATYLDLALHLSLPLATLDRDLAHASRKAGIPLFLEL